MITYIEKSYPDKKINIFGESYGANTCLQAYLAIKDRINMIILDSPMSKGEEMLDVGFDQSEKEAGLPAGLAKFLGNISSKIIEGYSYGDTNGIDKIDKITNPILIITGKNDKVAPMSQAQAVYDKAIKGKREMLLSSSKHAEMFFKENQKYIDGIYNFIDKYKSKP